MLDIRQVLSSDIGSAVSRVWPLLQPRESLNEL
jgi:hypothetical protein